MLACELHTFSVHECPPYTALSYTWGSSERLAPILLGGQQFLVRENLWSFLDTMRLLGRWRLFWIDAICIDQSSNRERSHQVAMMRQIYAQAALVVVWLGGVADSSDLAVEYIANGAQGILLPGAPRNECVQIKENLISALRKLLERPYWSRIWTVQELMVAKDTIFFCGQKSFTWRQVASIRQRTKNGDDDCIDSSAITGSPGWLMVAQKTIWESQPQNDRWIPLPELLKTYRDHQSTDPRDRVYALLGLAPGNLVEVDYDVSLENLFFKVLNAIIRDPVSRRSHNALSCMNALQKMLGYNCR
jgi:hypothetical protein